MTALAMEQDLAPAPKIVLYWIANHHNGETGLCFPSINRLAKVCRMSRRSVEKHIADLAGLGLIQVTQRFRAEGGKTSNSYQLFLKSSQEFQTDAQNLRMGSAKSAHGDTQNLRMNNLVRRNLGKEPNNIDEVFDEFWKHYPRKINKAAAKQSFATALTKEKSCVIIKGAKEYSESVKPDEIRFVPYPRTWLRQERWSEKPETEIPEMNGMKKALEELGLSYE
jgi:hypothetical protein